MWGAIAGFAVRHVGGLILAAKLVAIAAVLGSLLLYVRGAERAKAQVPVLEAMLDQQEAKTRQNQAAYERCEAVNTANASEAARQLQRARDAEIRLAQATGRADGRVETIRREAEAMPARDCPGLDEEFRRWVLEGR